MYAAPIRGAGVICADVAVIAQWLVAELTSQSRVAPLFAVAIIPVVALEEHAGFAADSRVAALITVAEVAIIAIQCGTGDAGFPVAQVLGGADVVIVARSLV